MRHAGAEVRRVLPSTPGSLARRLKNSSSSGGGADRFRQRELLAESERRRQVTEEIEEPHEHAQAHVGVRLVDARLRPAGSERSSPVTDLEGMRKIDRVARCVLAGWESGGADLHLVAVFQLVVIAGVGLFLTRKLALTESPTSRVVPASIRTQPRAVARVSDASNGSCTPAMPPAGDLELHLRHRG